MEFLDYDKLISDRKNDIIDSHTSQAGEVFRKLLENNFDNIRFCFFETPKRIRDYIKQKSLEDGKKLTIEFLEELGFDISTLYESYGYILNSSNEILNKMLHAFFPSNQYMTLFDINRGIFAYFNGDENQRFIFKHSLAGINLSDEEIRKILSILEKYKQKYLDIYNPLIEYANELDRKIETLIDEYKRNEKNSGQDKKKLRYEIAKLCIINNFDLDEFEIGTGDYECLYHRNLDVTLVKALSTFVKNKKRQYVPIVYISPLDKDYEFLDTVFDHETRHALEYNINGNILKCGIQLEKLDTGEKKYHYLNEVMTQKLSIESTLERQKRGIYIFPDQKKYDGVHCDYDEYLDVITKYFPYTNTNNFFVQCRLMGNLDNLYKYYSDEELDKINSEIMPEIQDLKRK